MEQARIMKWAVRDWRVVVHVASGRRETVSMHTTKQGARAARDRFNAAQGGAR